jgi:hypothetical protein
MKNTNQCVSAKNVMGDKMNINQLENIRKFVEILKKDIENELDSLNSFYRSYDIEKKNYDFYAIEISFKYIDKKLDGIIKRGKVLSIANRLLGDVENYHSF